MRCAYLTKCTVKNFNPFCAKSIATRIVVNWFSVHETRQRGVQLDISFAPKEANVWPELIMTYKDGTSVKINTVDNSAGQLSDLIDRYSKTLRFKEMLNS